MKRVLLANFGESPENYHFERALLRARGGRAVDIVHDFDHDYSFIGRGLPPGARRLKYSGLAGLKKLFARPYDLLVLLDFPKRPRCAPGFMWLLREAPARRRVFVANHLIPMPGDNFTADLARKTKALSAAGAGYMLEFDDRVLWAELGLAGARLLKRGYAVDCAYYSPVKVPAGDYVFSAGSTGRDFRALAAGVKKAGLGLKVFSGSRPPALPRGAEFLPLTSNLHNLKAAAAGARAVVIPVKDGHVNEAAGNSIAFLSMALGRPVLTRRNRYMTRFIKDGVNGFLYGKLSPAAVAEGLRRIKSLSPARLARVSAAARRAMLNGASLDRFCSGLLRRFAA
jgi:glycosyltransferase involved in cell wall biosynthesis